MYRFSRPPLGLLWPENIVKNMFFFFLFKNFDGQSYFTPVGVCPLVTIRNVTVLHCLVFFIFFSNG